MAPLMAVARGDVLRLNRRTRRHPRPTQWDYLHLRRLLEDLEAAFGALEPGEVVDVLDIFCGSRPYDDLLPAGSRSVGLDIENPYGVADVVSSEFLPFDDASFDLVMCIEAFYYVEDPLAGVAEIARVLRPNGAALIAVPHVWEYDPDILEHRWTGPELERLFRDWEDVQVVENGHRAVVWAMLTGRMLHLSGRSLGPRARRLLGPVFSACYLAVNGIGRLLEALERRFDPDPLTLPMNLLLTARRPSDAG
jgi:SAM-dependent methyltransferase